MFSERLEKLIQSSLQDGILTDQEKAAIIKRAKAEGEDIDEVEIYIDSLLQKRQKELNNSAVKKKANTSNLDELKKLIEIAMTDGIITSKERTVIFNKAAALGIDAAEVEIYLDAEIQKAEQAADVEKRDKIGKVCPQCGKQVPPLALVCDCGFEFTGQNKQSSVQLLFDKINNIQLTDAEIDSCSSVVKEKVGEKSYRAVKDDKGNVVKKLDGAKAEKLKEQKKLDIIQSFPVPNTKEDIMEFLALAAPNSKMKGGFFGTIPKRLIVLGILAVIIIGVLYIIDPPGPGKNDGALPMVGGIYVIGGAIAGAFLIDRDTLRWNKSANVWRAKFDQVLMKGRSLRADEEFTRMLDYYENLIKK